MMIIVLNRACKVLGWAKISQGGLEGTVADTRVIMQVALSSNASSFVLSHNHPSGTLKPSEADIKITKNVKEAGKVLGIELIDHIIMTSEGYFSFSDEGLL